MFFLFKQSLHATYNNLSTFPICCLMKGKDYLEMKMKYLNNYEFSFALTLCSYFYTTLNVKAARYRLMPKIHKTYGTLGTFNRFI